MAPQIVWTPQCAGGAAAPEPRSGHSFTSLSDDTHMLFGGTGLGAAGKAAYMNDAWLCKVSEAGAVSWAPLDAQPAPAPRARHTAVPLDGRRLLVFGGVDQTQYHGDLWVLDVPSKTWTPVTAGGPAPAPRAHHTGEKGIGRQCPGIKSAAEVIA